MAARRRIHELEGRLRASAASRQVLQGQVAELEQQQLRHASALSQERSGYRALQEHLASLSAEHADWQVGHFAHDLSLWISCPRSHWQGVHAEQAVSADSVCAYGCSAGQLLAVVASLQ